MRSALADPDRRRALFLTVLVHGLALLVLAWWVDLDLPEREPPEQFLVIDLGEPAPAVAETPAAADDAPAPAAPAPTVASDAPGAPTPGTPDEATGGEPAVEPDPVAEAPAAPAPPAQATDPVEPSVAEAPVEVPAPAPRPPEPAAPPPAPEVAAAVPEIEAPELEPRPLAEALPVPEPSAQAVTGAVTLPDASPEVQETTVRPLEVPEATVAADRATVGVPSPEASVRGPSSRSLAAPVPQAVAGEGRTLDAPQVSARAGDARPLGASPRAGVRAERRLPTPSVQATVRAAPADEAPGAAANVPLPDDAAGGDAPQAGQPGDDPLAAANARGLAGSPEGRPGDGGTPLRATPLQDTRPRPIGVLLDNTDRGYPQAGLTEASWIAEMPVEGGVTRLMPVFDRGQPDRVGPVRSARPYFVDVAARTRSILVHDGGSPDALVQLQAGAVPSLNAYQRGDLFARATGGEAPYNLFASGGSLRAAVNGLNVDAQRLLTGYRPLEPGEGASEATEVSIDWSGVYDSGFRYVPGQDRYRWIRNGVDAQSASGQAVQVEAILIARIGARPLPGDSAGRLYIDVRQGGEATLLWRGRVQQGTWTLDGGLRFVASDGTEVSLETMVTWAAFVPEGQEVAIR